MEGGVWVCAYASISRPTHFGPDHAIHPPCRFREGTQKNALAKPYAKYANARSTIEGEMCTKRESLLGSMVRCASPWL